MDRGQTNTPHPCVQDKKKEKVDSREVISGWNQKKEVSENMRGSNTVTPAEKVLTGTDKCEILERLRKNEEEIRAERYPEEPPDMQTRAAIGDTIFGERWDA